MSNKESLTVGDASSRADVRYQASLEREKTKAFLAKWSLFFLFLGIIASAAFGFFLGHNEAYALTASFGAAAMLILNHYF